MPVKIRLRRMGAKKRPFYRVVVADSRSPRDGRFIETIGTYNPLTNPPTTTLNLDRAKYWLSVGAQPTEAAERILWWQEVIPNPYAQATTEKPEAAVAPANPAPPAPPAPETVQPEE